ncbi:MAG: sulfatase-like hydrolase/transferase [Oscillospiraceae bacterium]|nr:sulfatase-like hydrolase/transferase [Oscillospiraceae bacterium]
MSCNVLSRPAWRTRMRRWQRLAKPSLFFFLSLVYQEFFLKLYCFRVIPVRGLIVTALFTVPIALLLGLWCAAVKPKTGQRVLLIVTAVLCVWLASQAVYYRLFETFMSLSSLVRTPMVAGEFGGMALGNILKSWFPILMLSIPFVGAVVGRRWLLDGANPRRRDAVQWATAALMVQMAITLLILHVNSGPVTLYHIYQQSDAAELMVTNFGVLTNTRRELIRIVFGARAESVLDPENGSLGSSGSKSEVQEQPPRPILNENDWVMDIDFDALIAEEEDPDLLAMHEYFASVEPTEKNEWTGYFKDKNLIWIVGEAFSTLALDPELTPTLCRLSQEGFVFNNFYTPLWGLSTSDGEYVTTTGLIPKAGTWSYLQSAENDMPFGFGHRFKARGYRTLAYHNNTYTYYGRDESYPNMGYEYYGVGNGLNVARTSPASDLEMMEKSLPQYLYEDRFMVYYLTFSGHLNYNREQNDMSAKHWDLVDDRTLTEGPKAYLASQVELDRAVGYLLEQLRAAGKLDDTVIVLSGDHYPYGLQDEEISELLGHPVDPDFEKYESTLILWNSEMKQPVQVDKYCSSLDVMPTLANLFDLEYDSRLLAGRDILSDAPGLVIFSNYSFLSERGSYRFPQEQFTPWEEGRPDDEAYVARTIQDVRDRFRFSALILDEDYYRHLFAPETME